MTRPEVASNPFDALHTLHLQNGRFGELSRDAASLDRIVAAIRAGRASTLVLHFHGGLVDRQAGIQVAGELRPVYEAAPGTYPLFFVWETGLLEILRNNLGEIYGDRFFQRGLWQLTRFVLGKLGQAEAGGRGRLREASHAEAQTALAAPAGPVPRAPRAVAPPPPVTTQEERQLLEALEDDSELKLAARAIAAELGTPAPGGRGAGAPARALGVRPDLLSPALVAQLRAEGAADGARGPLAVSLLFGGLVRVFGRVIGRFRQGRDHGVHATVVEELLRELYLGHAGQLVWSLMKQDTLDAFADHEGAAGTRLLRAVADLVRGGEVRRVVLVGHSAGSIYVCRWLDRAREVLPDLKFEVVFLAPACSFRLLASTLRQHGSRIGRFRLFAMRDDLERLDALIPAGSLPGPLAAVRFLYPHSLLYFVSGVCEDEADLPLVGMERYLTGAGVYAADRFPEIADVRAFLGAGPGRAVWSESDGGPGLRSRSRAHGDFDNDPPTLESVRQFIAG